MLRVNTCTRLQRLQVSELVSAGRHRLVHLDVRGRGVLVLQQHNLLRQLGLLLLLLVMLLLLLLVLVVLMVVLQLALLLLLLVERVRLELHLVVLVHERVAERVLQVGVAGRAVLFVHHVVVDLVLGAASEAAVQRRVRQIVVDGGLIDAHVAEPANVTETVSIPLELFVWDSVGAPTRYSV